MESLEKKEWSQLERCRAYLIVLARQQLRTRLRVKVDASDVVQETLHEAVENWEQFRGASEPVNRNPVHE